METKICKVCGRELTLDHFSKSKAFKDGYQSTCKECQKKKKLKKEGISTDNFIMEGTRVCPVCGKELPISEFGLDRRSPDGRRWLCRNCDELHKNINQGKDKNYFRKLRLKVDPEYRAEINAQKRKSTYNNHASVLLSNAKRRAEQNGWNFNLELKDIVIPDKCPILEVPFIMGTKGDYMYTPSIDRIDNSKGYIKGNIQIISMKANSMKNAATPEELEKFCKNILRYSLITPKGSEIEDKELQ